MVNQYFDGAWLEAGGKSSVIIVGTYGHTYCYGTPDYCQDPCGGGVGSHGYPYEAQMLFYDPEDFAKVAQGLMQPYEVLPYHIQNIENLLWSQCEPMPESMAYDRENGLIYVYQGINSDVVIHVWSIAHLIPSTVSRKPKDPVNAKMSSLILSVSPNPFSTSVDIKVKRPKATGLSVVIYDIKGKFIHKLRPQALGLYTKYTWNAQGHPAGTYLIQVSNGNKKTVIKTFLVQ
jgi:hypothetical protein